jgi:hypothetical protein
LWKPCPKITFWKSDFSISSDNPTFQIAIDDLECLPLMSKPNRIVCLTNPRHFEKIEPTKPTRADLGIVANWIEEDWASEYLFFWYLQRGGKRGGGEFIHCRE